MTDTFHKKSHAVASPGDPNSLACRGFNSRWTAQGRCPRCGRDWTDIFGTKDAKRSPFINGITTGSVPAHKERGKRIK